MEVKYNANKKKSDSQVSYGIVSNSTAPLISRSMLHKTHFILRCRITTNCPVLYAYVLCAGILVPINRLYKQMQRKEIKI